jgi:hypothetical protein
MRVVEFQTGGELVVFSMVTISGETGPRKAAIILEQTMEAHERSIRIIPSQFKGSKPDEDCSVGRITYMLAMENKRIAG